MASWPLEDSTMSRLPLQSNERSVAATGRHVLVCAQEEAARLKASTATLRRRVDDLGAQLQAERERGEKERAAADRDRRERWDMPPAAVLAACWRHSAMRQCASRQT